MGAGFHTYDPWAYAQLDFSLSLKCISSLVYSNFTSVIFEHIVCDKDAKVKEAHYCDITQSVPTRELFRSCVPLWYTIGSIQVGMLRFSEQIFEILKRSIVQHEDAAFQTLVGCLVGLPSGDGRR